METWNRSNKAILAKKLNEYSPEEFLREYTERVQHLEQLASTHIGWYTHKNPYGCWICDLILLNYRTLQSLESYLLPWDETSSSAPSSSKSSALQSAIDEVLQKGEEHLK